MIRSMTGFGRASFEVGDVAFEVETRSVNHRHLDIRVRLPRLFSALDLLVRGRVRARMCRGKVDVSVTAPEAGASLERLEIDVEVARKYVRAAEEIRKQEDLPGPLGVGTLLGLPGVARFVEPTLPSEELREGLLEAVASALESLDAMRVSEGAALERDLLARLARVAELSKSLEARSELVRDGVRERLRKRAEQLKREVGILDEARLHQEIVIAADRLDVNEEIVRLRSHVEQFQVIVASGGPNAPVGRRLDFLIQELAREANTIGSKGSDSPIAHQVVELKAEIERMREQVQNVE